MLCLLHVCTRRITRSNNEKGKLMALTGAQRQASLRAKQAAEVKTMRKELDQARADANKAWAELMRVRAKNNRLRKSSEGKQLMGDHREKRAKRAEAKQLKRAALT